MADQFVGPIIKQRGFNPKPVAGRRARRPARAVLSSCSEGRPQTSRRDLGSPARLLDWIVVSSSGAWSSPDCTRNGSPNAKRPTGRGGRHAGNARVEYEFCIDLARRLTTAVEDIGRRIIRPPLVVTAFMRSEALRAVRPR